MSAGESEPSMAEKSKGNKPVYNARARQGGGSDYMTTIGAAFAFKEGEGLVVNLSFIPAPNENGFYSFILVPNKDEPKDDG